MVKNLQLNIDEIHLISKINSVNEAMNDTNVLINVFDNNVKTKVDVVDYSSLKVKEKNKVDLKTQIKNIFVK